MLGYGQWHSEYTGRYTEFSPRNPLHAPIVSFMLGLPPITWPKDPSLVVRAKVCFENFFKKGKKLG